MASYCVPVQWITTVTGSSQGQLRTSGSLPRPLESRSMLSLSTIAERLYSIRKYHLRFLGGLASGEPAFLRSRQLLRLAKKACTQASAVWAWSLSEGYQRIRCFGCSQMPLCRTVRHNQTSVCLYSLPHSRA